MFGVWASLCLAVGAAARDAPVARETDFFSSWLRRSALFDGSSPWAPGDLWRDLATLAAPGDLWRDLATLAAPEHLAAHVERTEAVDVRDAEGAKDEALRSRLRSADDVAAALHAGASVVVKLDPSARRVARGPRRRRRPADGGLRVPGPPAPRRLRGAVAAPDAAARAARFAAGPSSS